MDPPRGVESERPPYAACLNFHSNISPFLHTLQNGKIQLTNFSKSLAPLFKAGGSPEGSALWPPEADTHRSSNISS